MAATKTAPAAKPAGEKRIKVRAIRLGYHDLKRRREGNVFSVLESEFSETWMERVSDRTPELTTTGRQELQRHHDELLATRAGVGSDAEDL